MKLQFRSIAVVHTEIPMRAPGMTMLEMNYDRASARQHSLELGTKDILQDKSWVLYFFLTLMIVSAVAFLSYGISALAVKIDWGKYSAVVIPALIIFYLLLWAGFSVPAVIKKKKENHVNAERGEGNWRIVDENKWEKFEKMLALSAKKSGPRV